ncbi:alpha-1,6-mannosyl-glycoprotein 2-beta-N-acetylglucosaminyltransferase isoform X5 [Leguminivora glycinivorella]|uniref:alpha-1,6-mannosyl-glycoprotein 2-beta-N-acetylglucosaminyltransferase isoform X5 n=1 Tax=Leguminivora glycinivorella TaxID=1035111 RepID=UPI002010BE84|nr:alpha-1,6-mannosyl-glycoprotein 2-beta-N-acetylglucosaminyltransferase isoform X5 [Leguminivora glycinivorella]
MPRLKYATFLRVLVILGLFCVWLQIMVSSGLERDGEELMNGNDTSEQVLALVPQELHKYLTVHPKNNTANTTDLPKNITEIRRAIKRYNDAQTIYNEDIYGPVLNDTVIIAIQVHTRLTYLRHLIVSLAQARDIERTLLVFSHDYYDEEINSLVRTIDFTKVMQIFYPFSIQTHPNEFPGVDPNDCPRDAKFEQAIKLKCNNALHPDLHGHYREAKYTQTKHHWWWKANRIFNQLQSTASHTGMVVFLEEDHYVAEDFLHVLNLMRTTADKTCPQCELLSLGTYLKTYQYHATADKVEITPWHSSIHNMGMVFNRTVWNSIMSLQDQFCEYDDYNWDYSLLHLSQNRKGKEKFKVMMCKGPRVFHIGECGLHHKKSNCNANLVISKVQKLLQTTKRLLYPKRLTASINPGGAKHNKKLVKGNGGWGDRRDQEMCTNMTKIERQLKKYTYFA